MPIRTFLGSLLITAFCFAGCGGGGGGDDEDADPIAAIAGPWTGYGLLSGGLWEFTIGAAGEVSLIVIDGNTEPLTGAFRFLGDRLYGANLVTDTGSSNEVRLLLDADGEHAAFFDVIPPISMAALQRGLSTASAHTLADYLGPWEGEAASFDSVGGLTLRGSSEIDVEPDGTFAGQFGALQFADDTGNGGTALMLRFANGRALEGSYTDNDGGTDASQLFVAITPDEAFLAAVAFDTDSGLPLFFAAWSRP